MENKSDQYSWLDKAVKRFKNFGNLIPPKQEKVYRAISSWCEGRTVIDIGCSLGVGSNILSNGSRFVWGIDINEEAVGFASKAFSGDNLEFAVFDIEHPPTRPISTFEVIVCIEVIEHLANVEVGLDTIKRFFSRKGNSVGFISVPNIANEKIRVADSKNNQHLQHWTTGDFYALMINHFQSVTLFGASKLDRWDISETVDGNSNEELVIAKVEGLK